MVVVFYHQLLNICSEILVCFFNDFHSITVAIPEFRWNAPKLRKSLSCYFTCVSSNNLIWKSCCRQIISWAFKIYICNYFSQKCSYSLYYIPHPFSCIGTPPEKIIRKVRWIFWPFWLILIRKSFSAKNSKFHTWSRCKSWSVYSL